MAQVRRTLDGAQVSWQTGEVGKVDLFHFVRYAYKLYTFLCYSPIPKENHSFNLVRIPVKKGKYRVMFFAYGRRTPQR